MALAKKGCVDDLATLSELNEEIILQELQARYHKDIIYVRKWNDMVDEDLLDRIQYVRVLVFQLIS